jgi:hypothetical protein
MKVGTSTTLAHPQIQTAGQPLHLLMICQISRFQDNIMGDVNIKTRIDTYTIPGKNTAQIFVLVYSRSS